ncbi:ImmA/IrrE family metallo-endopeptidase [Lentibacillus cibarius]|uniref:ImmA/IrrE family metallo-endopeptidase n=1 Tax=Lentibacillus cibarius TaxID=2583219 RepID=A0A549YAB4_9BACI|nr:ImmA/IrrE family metallo-endopeptidase [Lentibacillus cibarius]TRM08778.1 ImmA/IrrE family metallo-endopeptidase [Lentibacillus cibarius]TRM08806.1 ImmA/IrrE family metallo-endopeptidase [Lentibacillus cibarius]TRM12880.1 ImmA/IrrE family metallo-endopeptidase [Lentibacillus cibarius]
MAYEYRPFQVEKWISRFYYKIGIVNPEDIDERTITKHLGIHLTYKEKRSFSAEDGQFKLINIDSRLSGQEQREHFYHELCHVLRHYGSQLLMPKAFIELQEFDAKRFTRYAAIPFDMLKLFDLKSPYIVQNMAYRFNISEKICKERLDGIHRNKKPKKDISMIEYL